MIHLMCYAHFFVVFCFCFCFSINKAIGVSVRQVVCHPKAKVRSHPRACVCDVTQHPRKAVIQWGLAVLFKVSIITHKIFVLILLCGVLLWFGTSSDCTTSLALWKSYDCRISSEATLKSMDSCKTAVSPLLTHLSYCGFALSQRNVLSHECSKL